VFKVVWVARFPQGMAKEDARRHWADVHGPLCIRSSIPRYVQNHVLGPLPSAAGVPDDETHFDGYSCGWWPDEDAFRATMAEPAWQALVDDGDNVFDMDWTDRMSAQVVEHTIVEGPRGPYKVAWVCFFKPGLDPEEARDYWLRKHGPIVADVGIGRYVQNHAVASVGGGGEGSGAPAFGGFSECWFDDERAFLDALATPEWAALAEDGHEVFDMSVMWGARLLERVVRAGDLEGVAA
jgi:uncharacterized protein (TIGR02118 family)